jgi:uncharacterized Tic20 family protein
VLIFAVVLLTGAVLLGTNSWSLILAALAFALVLASLVLSVFATIWAARGKAYHYPLDIKMIR